MLKQEDFLRKYNIESAKFEETELSWDELNVIRENYIEYSKKLTPIAEYIIQRLRNVNEVHSIRFRLKDSEHLIAKIIRKK